MNCAEITSSSIYPKQPSIMGQSTSGTCIYQYSNTGSGYPSFIINGQTESSMTISNLYFNCQFSSYTGCCGIQINNTTNINVTNVTVDGGYYGIQATNVFSSVFNNVFVDWCVYCGMYFGTNNVTDYPNSMTFIGCNVGHCGTYGYYFNGGTTISITGGGVQGCGQLQTEPTNTITEATSSLGAGIYAYNCGANGTNSISLSGVYFESNSGQADIFLSGLDYSYTSSISGCNFNRLQTTKYTMYNIYNYNNNNSATPPIYCMCSVNACGFGLAGATTGGNDYTETANCPYIYSNSNNLAPTSWTNCLFYSSVAVPTIKNSFENNYGNTTDTTATTD